MKKLVCESLAEYQIFTRTGPDSSHKGSLRKLGIGGIQPGDMFVVKKKLITHAGVDDIERPAERGKWFGASQYDRNEILKIVNSEYLPDGNILIEFHAYRSYHAALEDREGWTTDVGGDTSSMELSVPKFEEHFEEINTKSLPRILDRLRKMRPNTPQKDL
jgi:hypothetical protein